MNDEIFRVLTDKGLLSIWGSWKSHAGVCGKEEDIMVTFKSLMAGTTQAVTQVAVQNIENSIPMRIIKVIKNNPALSQSQIAEMLGEKHDTIKYHMRKMSIVKKQHKGRYRPRNVLYLPFVPLFPQPHNFPTHEYFGI